jgi:hypothetical protein
MSFLALNAAPPATLLPSGDFQSSTPLASYEEPRHSDWPQPNTIVRWVFYLSLFAIPFAKLSLPGTGGRVTVVRLLQIGFVCAILSQPRVCIRLLPTALLWFFAYCIARVLAGFWLAPDARAQWLPSSLEWLQFSLPWVWVMFNVLQFPNMGRRGLWALASGCAVCALFHMVGVGVVEVEGHEGRSSVFGENANTVGATYAIGLIALVGLGMFRDVKMQQRLLILPLVAAIAMGLANTGSRSAVLILAISSSILIFLGQAFGSKTKRLALVVAICVIFGAVIWHKPTLVERFRKVSSSAELQKQEGRVRMAPVLWDMFLRSPIYGSGPDSYQWELTRRAMPYRFEEQIMIAAHNLVLLLLVETGLIGFLLFSFGVKGAITAAWRARLKPSGSLPLALLLSLIVAGASVSEPSHYLVFWFSIAYALGEAS